MKTEFDELWSEFKYTDHFDTSSIRLWYLDKTRLRPLWFDEIIDEEDSMIVIKKPESTSLSYIPYYRIYLIDYNEKILLDRRDGYQGNAQMDVDL